MSGAWRGLRSGLETGAGGKLAAHNPLPKLPVDRIDADSLDGH